MRREPGRWSGIGTSAVIAASMIACAGSAASPVVSTGPGPSVQPLATAASGATSASIVPASAAASPTDSGPVRFASTQYPYALTLPATMLTRRWAAAQRVWDGVQRFDMLGPLLDRVGVPDGGLYLIGGAAPSGLQEFTDRGVAKTNLHHDCTKPTGERSVKVGAVRGVAFSQDCAGQFLVRVTLVREEQGVIAFILANAAAETRALDDLIELLAGLEWTAP
ncbi:MAG: hypothetical protein H0U52_04665 [Chloroflexi bacterium]|nr:hypothetical protein [Chloroflexota bacterium]